MLPPREMMLQDCSKIASILHKVLVSRSGHWIDDLSSLKSSTDITPLHNYHDEAFLFSFSFLSFSSLNFHTKWSVFVVCYLCVGLSSSFIFIFFLCSVFEPLVLFWKVLFVIDTLCNADLLLVGVCNDDLLMFGVCNDDLLLFGVCIVIYYLVNVFYGDLKKKTRISIIPVLVCIYFLCIHTLIF